MAKFELWMTATLLVFLTFSRFVQASPPEEEFEANHYGSCVCKQSCDCPSEGVLQRITRVEESVQINSESQTEQAVVLERKMALLHENMIQRITQVEESVQIHSENQTEQAVVLERKMALLQDSVLQNAQVTIESRAEIIETLGRKLDGLQEPAGPPSWLCPEEFTYNSESRICIKLYRDRVTWAAANNSCQSIGRGYRLAVVDTSQKLQFVQAFLSATVLQPRSWHDQCWVGGYQEDDEGRWLWSTGAEVTHGWGTGQPSNGFSGAEDCLTLAWGPDWDLNDNKCNQIKPYICEYQFN